MNRLELIENINSLKLIQKECWEDVDFPQEIQEVLDTCNINKTDLDVDKHRWYETSVTVYELNGEHFGIRYVTDTFSEQSSIEDMSWQICAIPMKAIQSVKFVKE